MTPIYCPENPADLALAECILLAEGIPYFVHNKHFGGLYPGMQMGLHNVITVMVPEADLVRARHVLAELLTVEKQESFRPSPSLGQTFRLVFEYLFFAWFIPTKGHRKDHKTSGDDGTNVS